MNERDEVEKNLVNVGKLGKDELASFSLEELQHIWIMYLFETRKGLNTSENRESKQESDTSKVDDYA